VDNCKRCHWWLLACMINSMLSIIVLPWHAVRLYILPCFIAYIGRCCGSSIRCLCGCCGENCWKYTDSDFPPNSSSLGPCESGYRPGNLPPKKCCGPTNYHEVGGDVKWVRTDQIFKKLQLVGEGEHGVLFEGKIEAKDVAQGALGNCWLLASIACLAERDGIIPGCFHSLQYSHRGQYKLRLFDPKKKEFMTVMVDDHIPCDAKTERPLFTTPHGRELWVLLLEKAVAKLMGSYASTEGGLMGWGMHLMTGMECKHYGRANVPSVAGALAWEEYDIVPSMRKAKSGAEIPSVGLQKAKGAKAMTNDDMFKFVSQHVAHWPMGAGSSGQDNTRVTGRSQTKGIVPGHAYSIMSCDEYDGHKLIRLRNPWGTFEWGGDWSPSSPLWNSYPKVKKAIHNEYTHARNTLDDSGTFWMSWPDFMAHFDQIDVCENSGQLEGIKIDIHEEEGCGGPIKGCCRGCCGYWCCCKSCGILYCGRICKGDDRVHSGGRDLITVPSEINPMSDSHDSDKKHQDHHVKAKPKANSTFV